MKEPLGVWEACMIPGPRVSRSPANTLLLVLQTLIASSNARFW